MKKHISNRDLTLLLGVLVAVVIGLTVWYYGESFIVRSVAEPAGTPTLTVKPSSLLELLPLTKWLPKFH